MRNSVLAAVLLSIGYGQGVYAATNSPSSEKIMDQFSIHGTFTLSSDYRSRGFSKSNLKPSVQGGLILSHESGAYLMLWGASATTPNGGSIEADAIFGYTWRINDNNSLDIFYADINYPGGNFSPNGKSADFGEYGLMYKRSGNFVAKDKFSAAIYYSPDYLFSSGNEYYFSSEYSFPMIENVQLFGSVGYTKQDSIAKFQLGSVPDANKDNYFDYKVGFRGDYKGVTAELAWVGNNIKSQFDIYDGNGNSIWLYRLGFSSLLPYFKKAENNESLSGEYHGGRGHLAVSDTRLKHPLTRAFIKAGQEFGLAYVTDFNAQSQQGVGFYQHNIKNGERGSTSRTYLASVRQNPQLTLQLNTQVNRVLLEHGKATAIKCRINGAQLVQQKFYYCQGLDRKHILKNLELSGYYFGKGEASSILEEGAFMDTNSEGRPDVQAMFLPVLDVFDNPSGEGKNYTHGITLKMCHLRPKSRGQLYLRSRDPDDKVRIEANLLQHPDDVQGLIRTTQFGLDLLKQPALLNEIDQIFSPSYAVERDDSAALEAFVREYCKTTYHPVGTCRMGTTSKDSVVDLNLKVHGIDQLYVIDCSVIPAIPSGNTNAPTIAIAEKGADLLI
ncbi:hypothetical protein FQR65_LT19574 [Abscondita terminalis]|nr:hypothetical protein FQR65_LT19574 [Abscondita terminalis]